jgi:hypothetical protein
VNLKARLGISLSSGAFCFLGLLGCVGSPPVEEYNLARAAHDAASEAESSRYAQGLWYKADDAYKNAIRLYKDRKNNEAREEFNNARELLEKAENAARLSRIQSGGVPQ